MFQNIVNTSKKILVCNLKNLGVISKSWCVTQKSWCRTRLSSLVHTLNLAYTTGAGTSAGARRWDPSIVTVSNLIRCVCAVIMRGLTNCRDNPQHFRGVSVRTQHSEFKRTGAAEVCGISLFNFEQIMRFWHLVDSTERPPKEDDAYDKCYLVRPIIKLAQSAFQRWCTPGRDSALDEGGLDSRHNWLRKRDPSKPNTYFIELVMLCAAKSRFCLDFFVNEGQSKNIKRTNRRPGQHGYKKVPYKQFEFTDEDFDFALSRGATAGHMQYFARRLRERVGNDGYIYHIHVDKRWCNVTGMVAAMDLHQVAFTCSVKKGARFHVCYDLDMIKSKKRANRGKYRCQRLPSMECKSTRSCGKTANLLDSPQPIRGQRIRRLHAGRGDSSSISRVQK